jgi:hypothetical protein
MQRYPRQSPGLAKPITEIGYEIVPHERGKTSQHHLYYNRASYQNIPIRHQFRNLVDHVVTMENGAHSTSNTPNRTNDRRTRRISSFERGY